ncbi:sulfotransferase [Phaeobacter sp. C3_T13_0]|uniref:sulfotransferase n=1 Tax=Phaeobacter cretensis TaxID=3342641 RepID=UPI0039BD27FB
MPQNLFETGFARTILPEAKFIFQTRHALDVGLSLFSNNFSSGHYYINRHEWIGHIIRASFACLDDYTLKLGPRLHVQSYRKLVDAPEDELRTILSNLDLENASARRPRKD